MRLAAILSKGTALAMLDLTSKALPLVTFPIVVRALGPDLYGQVSFALAIQGLFLLVSSPGVGAYGVRAIAADRSEARHTIESLLGVRLALSTISFCLLTAYTLTFPPADTLARNLTLLFGVSLLASALDLQWVQLAYTNMWLVALIGAGTQIIYGLILIFTVRSPLGVWSIPVGFLAAAILSAVAYWFSATRDIGPIRPRFSLEATRAILPSCMMLGAASFMSLLYDKVDTVMIKYFRTPTELGVYTATYKIMTLSLSFTGILSQLFLPLISKAIKEGRDSERKFVSYHASAVILLGLPIMVGGMCLAASLTHLLLGVKFTGAAEILIWLMPTVPVAAAATFFGGRLIAARRDRTYLGVVSVGGISNVVLNLLFIPRYGAFAAATTTFVSQAAVALVGWYCIRDRVNPQVGALAWRAALACIPMAGAVRLLDTNAVPAPATVLVGAIVFAAGVVALSGRFTVATFRLIVRPIFSR